MILKQDGVLSVEDLVAQITPKARELVPLEIKKEVYESLNRYIQDEQENL